MTVWEAQEDMEFASLGEYQDAAEESGDDMCETSGGCGNWEIVATRSKIAKINGNRIKEFALDLMEDGRVAIFKDEQKISCPRWDVYPIPCKGSLERVRSPDTIQINQVAHATDDVHKARTRIALSLLRQFRIAWERRRRTKTVAAKILYGELFDTPFEDVVKMQADEVERLIKASDERTVEVGEARELTLEDPLAGY